MSCESLELAYRAGLRKGKRFRSTISSVLKGYEPSSSMEVVDDDMTGGINFE